MADEARTIADLWAIFRRNAMAEYLDENQQLALAKSIFYAGAYGCCALVVGAPEPERQQALKRLDDELDAWRQAKTEGLSI